VQNVGDSELALSSVYVEGVLNTPVTPLPIDLNRAETAQIVLSGFYTGSQVTVKVVTLDGTFVELTKMFTSGHG
jgi:hypothetical protein